MVEYLNPRATKIIGGENFTQKKILMKELLTIKLFPKHGKTTCRK